MSSGINHSRNYKYLRLSNVEPEFDSGVAGEDSDNEHEHLELQQNREINKRNKLQENKSSSSSSTPENDIIVVDKPIVAGESLASISLKYRISISELKRVNKIQKDIEFYALSIVKIPVRTNSALLDILNDEMQSDDRTHSSSVESATLEPFNDKHIEAVKTSLANKKSNILGEDLENDSCTSHNVRLYSAPEDKVLSTCSGADWDLSWWKVLLLGVIFLLGVPFIYYFFYVKAKN